MKKLARKLSVFALSSVMLLSNSPIKAGMFADGQTYNSEQFGKVEIENYHSSGNSVESFDILGFHCEIAIYQDGYAVDFTNNITGSTFYCRWVNEPGQVTTSTLILKDILDEISKKPVSPFVKKTSNHTKQKKKNKHIEESKPKKAIKAKYHQLTYALPTTPRHNNKEHCSCSDNEIAPIQTQQKVKAEGTPTILNFYVCRNCKKPIQQYRVKPRTCCWQTYCKGCNAVTNHYMRKGTGNNCVLRCCEAYPFEIHEIEYASTKDFNNAADQGEIKHICSKDPDHTRAHTYKWTTGGARCQDCLAIRNAKRSKK